MLESPLRVLCSTALAVALCVAPATYVSAQSTAAAPAVSSDITVLSTGAAPRQTLRYTLVKGATESGVVRQKMTMNMEMGGMAMPAQSLPTMVSTMQYTVTDVAPDGTAAVTGEFVSMDIDAAGADPMIADAMRPQLSAMNGMKMSYRISPTGEVSNMKIDGGAAQAMQAMQAMGSTEQMSVSFPTEAVGVGARWKAVRPVSQNGMTITQDIEYEVKSLSADSMVLDMVLVQSAKNQVMDAAAMPAGAKATVRTLDGKGTSTVVIRFNSAQPSMDMKMNVNMAIDLEMGGELNSMNQTMVMEVKSGPVVKP